MARRVLWIVKGLGPGGAERLLVELAKVLDPAEVEVTCAYVLPWKDHLAGELEAAGVRCVCLSQTRNDLRWPIRLRSMLKEGHFDVVHVHSPLPGSMARLVARTLRDAPPFVTTEHNAWQTFALPTRVLNRLTSRGDAVTYAVSDEVRDSMHGPAATRVQTLQHGIDVAATATKARQREQLRVELGLIPRELAIVTVANFRAQKDYPNLLQAAAILRDRGVRFRLIAVGQGPLADDIAKLRDGLALQEHVTLTGFRADATAVVAACDIFALASAWEGLPVAVMEALALSKPIVATAVGGVAEALRNDETALLVPPRDARALADALQRVLEDDELRTRLATASRAHASEFDVRSCARVQLDAYHALSPAAEHAPEPAPAKARTAATRGYEIREAALADRPAMLALLARSLGWGDDARYERFYAWKHDENPFGASPAWVAVDGDRLLGLRVFLRWEFVRGGDVVRAVRAVDTATDPEAQGRGIFRALTMHAVEAMAAEGVSFVFNTPNAQSRPGYLKMGWRDVGRYPVAVRVASPRSAVAVARAKVPADKWSVPLTIGTDADAWLSANARTLEFAHDDDVRALRTNASEAFLHWRYGTDLLGYRVVEQDGAAAVVRARRRGSATELTTVFTLRGPQSQADVAVARALREAHVDFAIRTGRPDPRHGFVPLPQQGPILTWRALADAGMPPLANWHLSLGDLELM